MLFSQNRPVALGQKGISLLHALLQASGCVVSKTALMQAAWPDAIVEESNLSVQIAALRKHIGPQPDGTDWIATVPREGYRFVGTVRPLDAESVPAISGQPFAASERPSILVLPFVNVSGDKQQEYLSDGITEDIIIALTRCRWFRVIGRSSSFFYKGRSVDPKQAAHDLGARYVLEGSVRA